MLALGVVLALFVGLAEARVIVGTAGSDRLVGTPKAERSAAGRATTASSDAAAATGSTGRRKGPLVRRLGNDTVLGGACPDMLDGGPGNDTIRARDTIDCGPGIDTVVVDGTEDGVLDCEIVQYPPQYVSLPGGIAVRR